jgi:plasmid maintenance system antidote protein VapI
MDKQARALAQGTCRAIYRTQKALGEAVDMTELEISQVFNGRKLLSEEEKSRLSEALGLPRKLFD